MAIESWIMILVVDWQSLSDREDIDLSGLVPTSGVFSTLGTVSSHSTGCLVSAGRKQQ